MKPYLIYTLIAILFLVACEKKETKIKLAPEDNLLLFKNARVRTVVEFATSNYLGSKDNFNITSFLKKTIEDASKNNFPVFSPDDQEKSKTLKSNEIKINAGTEDSQLNGIYFDEEWEFDSKNCSFHKLVNAWAPLRIYSQNTGNNEYKQVFIQKNKTKQYPDEKLIATNLRYNMMLDETYPGQYGGFSPAIFMKQIGQLLASGKIKAFVPDLKNYDLKTEMNQDSLRSWIDFQFYNVVFDEDWYFSGKSGSIRKVVKGMFMLFRDYGDSPVSIPVFYIKFNQKSAEKNDNSLLAKESILEATFKLNEIKSPQWIESLNINEFYTKLFSGIESGLTIPKVETLSDTIFNPISYNEILERLNLSNSQNIDFSQLIWIFFKEQWHLSKQNGKLYKDVKYYCPVLQFFKSDDSEKSNPYYKKIFCILYCDNDKYKPLAKNIRYQVPVLAQYTGSYEGYSGKQLVQFIFDKLSKGEWNAYQPSYIDDLNKIKIAKPQLDKILQTKPKEISDIVFVEDWKIGEKSMAIVKSVKGVALVKQIVKGNDSEKQVLVYVEFPL